ncbi:hypothetical protein F2P81_001984 [Scophthalmus maximus]|uniref:Uncharacterized protein n=1 Tax=Scophthalmus maximus TaxID=52904 RepID=A0A6A4TJT5_SCOMX|nr:hypothetical protein F2P81_001984 [Scophthalmus maximus]
MTSMCCLTGLPLSVEINKYETPPIGLWTANLRRLFCLLASCLVVSASGRCSSLGSNSATRGRQIPARVFCCKASNEFASVSPAVMAFQHLGATRGDLLRRSRQSFQWRGGRRAGGHAASHQAWTSSQESVTLIQWQDGPNIRHRVPTQTTASRSVLLHWVTESHSGRAMKRFCKTLRS